MNYTAQETDDLKYMKETGRGVMVKSQDDARKTYPNLFKEGVIYYDGFGPSVKLTTAGEQQQTKSSPTPGPWIVRLTDDGILITSIAGEIEDDVAKVFGGNDDDKAIREANAALIAAAPETAEKCDRILRAMIEVANRLANIREEWEMSDEVSASIVAEIDALNAAIDREEVWEPELIKAAKMLIDSGTHSEYTRGICELIADIHGRPGTFHVDRAVEIAQEIGLDIYEANKMYRTIPNGDTAPAQTVNQELLEALKAIMTDDHTVISTAKVEKAIQAIARAEGKEDSND